MARGDWSRRSIANERAMSKARAAMKNGFCGLTDLEYEEAVNLLSGPAPEEGWDRYEPNTYGGT